MKPVKGTRPGSASSASAKPDRRSPQACARTASSASPPGTSCFRKPEGARAEARPARAIGVRLATSAADAVRELRHHRVGGDRRVELRGRAIGRAALCRQSRIISTSIRSRPAASRRPRSCSAAKRAMSTSRSSRRSIPSATRRRCCSPARTRRRVSRCWSPNWRCRARSRRTRSAQPRRSR